MESPPAGSSRGSLRADVAGFHGGDHRQVVEPLQVRGDPLHGGVALAAELVGGHVGVRCQRGLDMGASPRPVTVLGRKPYRAGRVVPRQERRVAPAGGRWCVRWFLCEVALSPADDQW